MLKLSEPKINSMKRAFSYATAKMWNKMSKERSSHCMLSLRDSICNIFVCLLNILPRL